MTDSFPRQQARTQRFTLGAPRNITVAPDGSRVAFLRAAGPEDALTSLWVIDASSGERRWWRIPPRCSPATRPTCPRRNGCGGSGPGRARRASRATPRTPPTSWWRRPSPGSWWSPTSSPAPSSIVPVPSAVIDPRPDPTGTRVAWTDGRRLWLVELDDPDVGSRARRARTTRRCAGGWPSSPPPRRWTGSAGSGGRRTARPSSPRGSTTRPSSAGGSRIRPIPTRTPTEVAYPAAGTPNAEVTAWILRLDGSRTELALGPRRPPLPGGGRVGRPRAAPRPASPRPAPHRGARRRHHVRCDRGAVDRPRRRVGGARAGDARAAGGRARGRAARTRTIDDGSWWAARP